MSGRVAALVLAAGAASRMGRPKQLLRFRGETLVRRAVGTALRSSCDAVFAALGANADVVARELDGLAVTIVDSPSWAEGLAASIRSGVAAVARAEPAFAGVVLVLADQPHLGAEHLDALVDPIRRGGVSRAATESGGDIGAPAAFGRQHFAALQALRGDRGAKSLLRSAGTDLARVPCEALAVDIDTPADYDRLVADDGASGGR